MLKKALLMEQNSIFAQTMLLDCQNRKMWELKMSKPLYRFSHQFIDLVIQKFYLSILPSLCHRKVLFMFLKISYRQYNKWLHNPQTIILLFTLRCKTQSVCLCQSNMKAPTVLQSKNRALFVFALFNRQDSSTKWPPVCVRMFFPTPVAQFDWESWEQTLCSLIAGIEAAPHIKNNA